LTAGDSMADRVKVRGQRIFIGLLRGENNLSAVELHIEKVHGKPIVHIKIKIVPTEHGDQEYLAIRQNLIYRNYPTFDMVLRCESKIASFTLRDGASFIEDFLISIIANLKDRDFPWKSIVINDLEVVLEVNGKEMTVKEYLQYKLNVRRWIVALGKRSTYSDHDPCVFGHAEGPDMTEEQAMQVLGLVYVEGNAPFVRFVDKIRQADAESRISDRYDDANLNRSILLSDVTKKD